MIDYALVGEVKVAYTSAGDGPPLILLHGGEGDHSMFDGVRERLGRRFRTVAYDQRDCGSSVWTQGNQYDLADLAEEAAGFIAALGYERAHILGHSAGGLVAQMLAVRWPERVDHLILEVTMSPVLTKAHFDTETLRARQKMIDDGDDRGLASLFSTPQYVEDHPELINRFKAMRGHQTSEQMQRRMRALKSVSELDLSKVKAKTLVFAGERDQIVPIELATELANAIYGARLEIFVDVGHLGIVQDPDRFVHVVTSFLSE